MRVGFDFILFTVICVLSPNTGLLDFETVILFLDLCNASGSVWVNVVCIKLAVWFSAASMTADADVWFSLSLFSVKFMSVVVWRFPVFGAASFVVSLSLKILAGSSCAIKGFVTNTSRSESALPSKQAKPEHPLVPISTLKTEIERIYDRVEAETGKTQARFHFMKVSSEALPVGVLTFHDDLINKIRFEW